MFKPPCNSELSYIISLPVESSAPYSVEFSHVTRHLVESSATLQANQFSYRRKFNYIISHLVENLATSQITRVQLC